MAETVKHTPGPWKVRPHWSDEARFEVYPDRVVEFGAPAEIADVSGHSASDIDVEIAEAYANANLISAAPDLLEAVQETLRLFRYNTDDASDAADFAADVELKLEAAIAKAEGRS